MSNVHKFLTAGNSKLGKKIATFSIPAKLTCPGKTEACAKVCYACRGFFRMPDVAAAHAANYVASQTKTFVALVRAELLLTQPAVVRIHVAGDFYSAAYVRKWLRIVQAFPCIQFYAYTRSWRVGRILPSLRHLGRQPNMRLWFSVDKDSRIPARAAGISRAYMMSPGEPETAVPKNMDLVFRSAVDGVLKRVRQAVVCPVENGVAYQQPMTCETCKLCFRKEKYVLRSLHATDATRSAAPAVLDDALYPGATPGHDPGYRHSTRRPSRPD